MKMELGEYGMNEFQRLSTSLIAFIGSQTLSQAALSINYGETYVVDNHEIFSDIEFTNASYNYDYYRDMRIEDNGNFTFNGNYLPIGRKLTIRTNNSNSKNEPNFIPPTFTQNSGTVSLNLTGSPDWTGLYIGEPEYYLGIKSGKYILNGGKVFINPDVSTSGVFVYDTFEQNGGVLEVNRLSVETYPYPQPSGSGGNVYLNGGETRIKYLLAEPSSNGIASNLILDGGLISSYDHLLEIRGLKFDSGSIGKSSDNTEKIVISESELNGGVITAQQVDLGENISGESLSVIGTLTDAKYLTGQDLTLDGSLSVERNSNNVNGISASTTKRISVNNLSTNGGTAYFDRGGINSTGTFLVNNATWEVNNAVIEAQNATITNNGLINGGLKVSTNQTLTNNGTINLGNQNLRLDASSNTSNYGNIVAGVGAQINIESGQLINNGQITISNSVVNGTGGFNNSYGGYLSGSGTVLNSFENYGTVAVGSGALYFANAFNNHGLIAVDGLSAAITGGDITNTGTINGRGNISNNIVNQGTIAASNGTMILGGTVSNSANGLITAASGGQLLSLQGLATNNGVINLTGGVVDNNNHTMTNESQVSGYGTLRTGGLNNNGSVHITGGTTTVHGDVANNGQMQVSYDAAIFTGDVVNNGVFKTTDTTVTFTGSYTENGAYISDPSDNFFFNLNIGETGYLFGGVGDNWYVSGDLTNDSNQSEQWNTNLSGLFFNGAGESVFSLPGVDLGKDITGNENNFMWGELHIASGVALNLIDNDADDDAALYVGLFDFNGNIDFVGMAISSISSEFNIYYDADLEGNAYLGGNTFSLNGTGSLMGITSVPIPAAAWMFGSALVSLRLARRK